MSCPKRLSTGWNVLLNLHVFVAEVNFHNVALGVFYINLGFLNVASHGFVKLNFSSLVFCFFDYLTLVDSRSFLDIDALFELLTHFGVVFCPGCLAQGLPDTA